MKHFLFLLVLLTVFAESVQSQSFPNPATLSTGQGIAGSLDPIWTVSPWYTSNPPNPMGLAYNPALINNSCAPGAWVDPTTLAPPVNNGNWITGSDAPCSSNTNDGYRYFRLTLNLPASCNGHSITVAGTYILYFSGYADNTISDVYVNGTSTGISGGNFSSPLNMTLTGPWVAGVNYVDVLVYNFPNGGNSNPYGLLLVANSVVYTTLDSDGDGVLDINDQCPCLPGTLPNGCPPLTITGDSILCAGNITTLTASTALSYVWSTGATTSSITITPAATGPYSVTAAITNNYSETALINVTVNPLPVISITPPAISICLGQSAPLTAGGGIGYLWSNAASTAAITVSPLTTTPYSVTGSDANGCTATVNATVTVNPLPVATITPASISLCIGASTTLLASGGSGYAWGNGITTANNTVTPGATTPYSVTVTDANGCIATTSATVTVNPLPVVSINPTSVIICISSSTTLSVSGEQGYLWSNAATLQSITVSPVVTTPYSVTVTDANTCTATAGATVTVNPLPVPVISPATAVICIGSRVTLTASGGISYVWSNSTTSAANNVSPTINTSYSVTVTDNNACSATGGATVTVIPSMILSATGIDISCNGGGNGAINLAVSNGLAPYTYLWNTTSATQNITGLTAGNYTVTVTDNAGCTATAAASIIEPSVLSLSSSFNNPTCEVNHGDGKITLSALGGSLPYQYMWSNGNITDDLNNLMPGVYAVTLSDSHLCTATAAFSLAYIYDFTVQATPDVTLELGESTVLGYSLTGNAGNFVSLWSPSIPLSCSTCGAPMASADVTTVYRIEIKNDAGCIATSTVTVTIIPDYSLFVPNVFTPNNDGNNDVFKIYGNTQAIKYFDIQIYDRTGEKVFESNDYTFSWDGTYKGAPINPSVLIWQMKTVFIDGHPQELRKGTLTLIR